jgi:hypothetical protein
VEKPVEIDVGYTPETLKYLLSSVVLHTDTASSASPEVSYVNTSAYRGITECFPADFVPFWNIWASRGTPKGGQNLPANTGSIVPYHALPLFRGREGQFPFL